MKTSSKKAKGRRLQNLVAEKIQEKFNLPEADVKPAIMGETGRDIKLSTEAQEQFPFAVECKNVEKLNIWSALKQAEENAGELTPIVVFKRNRSETYLVIQFNDFMELL